MTIAQVLQRGKKFRRPLWPAGEYSFFEKGIFFTQHNSDNGPRANDIHLIDLLADDWEIYKKARMISTRCKSITVFTMGKPIMDATAFPLDAKVTVEWEE